MPQNELLNWKFNRAKIAIQITKPLPPEKLLKHVDPIDVPVWIECCYERFLRVLKHFTCQCHARKATTIALGDGSQLPLYGFWLKAIFKTKCTYL